MSFDRRQPDDGSADTTFAIERRDAENGVVLRFDGALRLGHRDAATGLQLVELVKQLGDDGACRVALDLSGLVKTPDSSGLGELVATESSLRQRGGRLVLVNIPEKLRQLIESLGLSRLFRVVSTEEEAVALFDEDAARE